VCRLHSTDDIPGIPKCRVLGPHGPFCLSVTSQHKLLLLEVQFLSGSDLVKSFIRIASQWEFIFLSFVWKAFFSVVLIVSFFNVAFCLNRNSYY